MQRLLSLKSQLAQQVEALWSKAQKKVKKTLPKRLTFLGSRVRLIKRQKERQLTRSAPNLEKSIV